MSLREPVFGADLITMCAWDHLHLAKIARILGFSEKAEFHVSTAQRLTGFVEETLYDKARNRYVDKGFKSGRIAAVNTPMHHFPAMLSPDPERRKHAIRALSPGGDFWGNYGLCTVSPEEPSFDPCRVWRGPIWLTVNFLCAMACDVMGARRQADAIARSSREIIRANHPLASGMMEYFNYLTGRGSGAHHIATMSAAPYLAFLAGSHHQAVSDTADTPQESSLRAGRTSGKLLQDVS